jgi:hypothetical protein
MFNFADSVNNNDDNEVEDDDDDDDNDDGADDEEEEDNDNDHNNNNDNDDNNIMPKVKSPPKPKSPAKTPRKQVDADDTLVSSVKKLKITGPMVPYSVTTNDVFIVKNYTHKFKDYVEVFFFFSTVCCCSRGTRSN